jgi:hypothetical protein
MSEPTNGTAAIPAVDEQAAVNQVVEQTPEVLAQGPETPISEPEQIEEERPTQDWRDKRLTRMAEQKAQARATAESERRRADDLQARLAQYEKAPEAEKQADPYEIAEQIAARRIQQMDMNRKSDALVAAGHKAYTAPEFDDSVRRLASLGAIYDDAGNPSHILDAMLDCDAPHDVLHYLGQNPGMVEDLSALSPRALIRAMAKLEAKVAAAPPRVSKAPVPVRPLAGKSNGSSVPTDDDDMATWMRKTDEQEKRARMR